MAKPGIATADLARLVCERPQPVEVGGRSFLVRPPSIGKSLLVASLLERLGIDPSAADERRLVSAFRDNEELVLRLLAMVLAKDKGEAYDEGWIAGVCGILREETGVPERVALLHAYLSLCKPPAQWAKALGVDRERRRLDKIMRAKDKSSSVVVGGVSIFGSLIDAACQRYGWTYEYTVWGIPLANLQLMLADAQQVVYLTDKERRRAGVSTDGVRLDADDIGNEGLIERILGN